MPFLILVLAAKSLFSVLFFILQAVKTASSFQRKYSFPQKSPGSDLDQVDKSLPPSICHTGTLPGAKGQMEDGEGLFSCITFYPLLENGKCERTEGSLSRALIGRASSTLLPSCGQMY